MSITVKKAFEGDYDSIYPLIKEMGNIYFTKETYAGLFKNHWNLEDNFYGYVMYDSDKVVGYCGAIFSKQIFDGVLKNVCNYTAWIVEPEYRKYFMKLFLPLIKIKDALITDMSASKEVYELLSKLGFKEYEDHYILVPPLPGLGKTPELYQQNECEPFLNDVEFKVYNDHKNFDWFNFVVKNGEKKCYLLFSRLERNKPPYKIGQLLYASDPDFFIETLNQTRSKLCKSIGVYTLHVDGRYANGKNIPFSIKRSFSHPKLFKGAVDDVREIQGVYSELAVLGL